MSDLEILLNDKQPDLVLICETWCNEETSSAMLNIDGYYIDPDLRFDRRDTFNGIGGGLIVYAKDGLVIKPLSIRNDFNQFVQFEVLNEDDKNLSLNITLVYRPPSANEANTHELCKLFNNARGNSIFIGDFNFPSIDWTYETADRKSRAFLESTKENMFEQMIDFKTHIRGNVLDLLFSNQPDRIQNIESLGNLANSDHSIIMVDAVFNSRFNNSSELISDWKNGDVEGLADYLKMADWTRELDRRNVEDAWVYFKDKIQTGTDLFIPKIQRRSNKRPQWMTKNVMRLTRLKQRHYNAYMQNRSQENKDRFNQTQTQCKRAVRKSKRKFEQKIATNGNKRPFNSYLKSKTKVQATVGPLKVGSEVISDNAGMANVLNESFCKVFSRENVNEIPGCQNLPTMSTINDVYFLENEVKQKISKLKTSSSKGPDNISTRFLKDFGNILAKPLANIFNKSMTTGQVPSDWKLANVTPIFKKGSKSNPENYRPVSLTSVPCKLMESIIRDNVVDHLLLNQLIKSSQHGFMKHKSCTTNLLEFLENVTKMVDNGDPVDIIYLDFSKAFDKVPKLRLIAKMKAHGIRGDVLRWISEWLSGRKQRTVLNGSFSAWADVISGVPQGSVLGPLAFIIFINDLDTCTELISIMNKFADDTKLGHKVNTDRDREVLQDCLNKLLVWATDWCMEFNVKKCKILHTGRNNSKFIYNMNGLPLEEIQQERDIGVVISNDLKPSRQCAEAARRASVVLGQVSRAFMYRDRITFLKLYTQFIRCHLEFAIPAWSPWTATDIEILEKVQRRAVNLISGLKGVSYEEKLKELGILSLEKRRKRFDLIQTYKILSGIDQVDSSIWFRTVGANAQRLTRTTAYCKKLIPNRSKTEMRHNFFSNRVVNTWNRLPTEVKEARTLNSFKKLLDMTDF